MKLEELIDTTEEILRLSEKDEKDQDTIKYLTAVYAALEKLTQYKARYAELNKGFTDLETGKVIHGCTPYVLERAKHNIAYLSESGKKTADQLEQLKKSFPLHLFSEKSCPEIEKWIEDNNIRPKDENYA